MLFCFRCFWRKSYVSGRFCFVLDGLGVGKMFLVVGRSFVGCGYGFWKFFGLTG